MKNLVFITLCLVLLGCEQVNNNMDPLEQELVGEWLHVKTEVDAGGTITVIQPSCPGASITFTSEKSTLVADAWKAVWNLNCENYTGFWNRSNSETFNYASQGFIIHTLTSDSLIYSPVNFQTQTYYFVKL